MKIPASLVRGGVLAAFVFGMPLLAQLPAAGDVDPGGRVNTKVFVTITGPSGAFGRPLSGVPLLVVSDGGDRVIIRTNDAGVASAWLLPGSYRVGNPDPVIWDGNAYTWDIVVPIRPGSGLLRLSQSNASKIEPVPASRSTSGQQSGNGSPSLSATDRDSVKSVTTGFFFAPHLLGATLVLDHDPTEYGAGLGLAVGYGFSRLIAVYVAIDVAKIDIVDPGIKGNYALGQGDLGLRFNFRDQSHRAIPYFDVAATMRLAQTTIDNVDKQISGPAFTVGGGLNYYFQPKVAFDVGLSYSPGKFDTFKLDGDETAGDNFDASGARFKLGLTFYPFKSSTKDPFWSTRQ